MRHREDRTVAEVLGSNCEGLSFMPRRSGGMWMESDGWQSHAEETEIDWLLASWVSLINEA